MAPDFWCMWTLLVISLCRGEKGGNCPDNVLSSASRCLPRHFSNGLINQPSDIKQHCEAGIFDQSVACVSELQSSCQGNRKQLEELESYMNETRWRDAWAALCQSVLLLDAHHSCWIKTLGRCTVCIRNEMMLLQQRLKDISYVSLSESSHESSIEISLAEALSNLRVYCQTSKGILRCFKPTLQGLCPPPMSRLLERTYLAFQPPFCDHFKAGDSSDDDFVNMESNETDTLDPRSENGQDNLTASTALGPVNYPDVYSTQQTTHKDDGSFLHAKTFTETLRSATTAQHMEHGTDSKNEISEDWVTEVTSSSSSKDDRTPVNKANKSSSFVRDTLETDTSETSTGKNVHENNSEKVVLEAHVKVHTKVTETEVRLVGKGQMIMPSSVIVVVTTVGAFISIFLTH